MKLAKMNFIVDISASIFCILSIFTGFAQWIIYPHQGLPSKEDFVLSHIQMYNLHLAASLIVILLIAVHLILHLRWLQNCTKTMKIQSRRMQINFGVDMLGIFFGIFSFVSGVVLWFVYPLGISGKGKIFFSVRIIPGGTTCTSLQRFSLPVSLSSI